MKSPYETFQSRNISKHDQWQYIPGSSLVKLELLGQTSQISPNIRQSSKTKFPRLACNTGNGCVSSNKRTALGLRVGLDYRL